MLSRGILLWFCWTILLVHVVIAEPSQRENDGGRQNPGRKNDIPSVEKMRDMLRTKLVFAEAEDIAEQIKRDRTKNENPEASKVQDKKIKRGSCFVVDAVLKKYNGDAGKSSYS